MNSDLPSSATYTLSGEVVSLSGRWRATPGWFERLVTMSGGTVAKLGKRTTVVVKASRPAEKAIAKLLSSNSDLKILELADFQGHILPYADDVLACLRTPSGLERLKTLMQGSHGVVDLHGGTVIGTLGGGARLEVSGCNLQGVLAADRFEVSGEAADFSEATLRDFVGKFELRNCTLQNALFEGSNFRSGSSLVDCDLRGARLHGKVSGEFLRCDLRGADLCLEGVMNLVDCDLRGATLSGDWRCVELLRCTLDGVDLTPLTHGPRSLQDCSLVGARLLLRASCALGTADLTRADLGDSHLYGIDLRNSRLEDVVVDRADLTGAIRSWPKVEVPTWDGDGPWSERNFWTALSFHLPSSEIVVRVTYQGHDRTVMMAFQGLRGDRRIQTDLEDALGVLTGLKAEPMTSHLSAGVARLRKPEWNEAASRVWSTWLGRDLEPKMKKPRVAVLAPDAVDIPLPAHLFELVATDPSNESAWRVLADKLIELGSPRGELLATLFSHPAEEREVVHRRLTSRYWNVLHQGLQNSPGIRLLLANTFFDKLYLDPKVKISSLRAHVNHPGASLLREIHSRMGVRGRVDLHVELIRRPSMRHLSLSSVCSEVFDALPTCPHIRAVNLQNPGNRTLFDVFPGVEDLTIWNYRGVLDGLRPVVVKHWSTHTPPTDLSRLEVDRLEYLDVREMVAPERLLEATNLKKIILRGTVLAPSLLAELRQQGVDIV